MKTAMQEMLEWVRATLPMDLDTSILIEQKIQSLLEKEREQILEANSEGQYLNSISLTKRMCLDNAEQYYNEIYGGDK